MGGPTYRKLGDDDGHDLEYFCVTGIGDISVVVNEYSIKKSRHDVCSHHLEVISLLDISLDELQDLFLDRSQSSYSWHLGCNFTWGLLLNAWKKEDFKRPTISCNRLGDHSAGSAVHGQHV